MNGLAKMQQRYAGLAHVQRFCPCPARADRMAYILSAIRRFNEVGLRVAHAAATRSPFAS